MRIFNIMDLDNPTELSKHGSFKYAKNIQVDKTNNYIEIENGLDDIYDFSDYNYEGKIETPDVLFLFYTESIEGGRYSKLHIYKVDDNVNKIVTIDDSRYNGKKIDGTYTYNYKKEIVITFGTIEHYNSPEILIINTSNTYDTVDIDSNTYQEFLLNPDYYKTNPNFNINIGSGSLETGVYFVCIFYEDNNKNLSPASNLSRPIVINSNTSLIYGQKMSESGKPSGRSIELAVLNTSSIYKKARIGIIHYANKTVKSVKITNTISYSNLLSYNITSLDGLEDIALEQITVKNPNYLHGKSFANSNDKLLIGGVKTLDYDFNTFQSIANNINIKYNSIMNIDMSYTLGGWTVPGFNDDSGITQFTIKGFRRAEDIYNYQPFKTGEVYCFYIGFKYIKGGYISVNHIPNNNPNTDKYLSIYETNKTYPNNYIGIGGEKMRFHKMPEFKDINDGSNIISLLGIDVENVVIPDNIKDICTGYEILYAKRTNDNITRLGSAVSNGNKLLSFDLQYNKYPSDNIKKLYRVADLYENIQSSTNIYLYTNEEFENQELGLKGVDVQDIEYISGIDDETTYDHVKVRNFDNYVDLEKAFYDIVTTNEGSDIYSNIENQELISTGKIFSTNIVNTNESGWNPLFGGDVYISRYPIKLYGSDDDMSLWYVIAESNYNLELRHEQGYAESTDEIDPNVDEWRLIFPQTSPNVILSNSMPKDKGDYINDEFGNSYDITYNKVNDILNPAVLSDEYPSEFYNRIVRSSVNSSESTRLGWRVFKPNDYIDIGFDRGDIVNIKVATKKLYIQLQYGLFLAQIKDVLQLANEEQAWLGTGDLFDRAPIEILYDEAGGIGCRDRDSCIYTKFGYVVADRDRNAIYLIGNQPKDITQSNFKTWFSNIYNGKDNTIVIGDDTYDRNRLLLKIDNNVLSYNVALDGLLSFHEYDVKDLSSNRKGSYVISDTLKKFNIKRTTFDSYIDINITAQPEISKKWEAFIFETKYLLDDIMQYDKTIDEILIYNDTQCSDYLKVGNNKMWYDSSRGSYISGKWYYNNFRDAVINDKLPIMENYEPTENVDKNQKNWLHLSQFISNFVTIRLKAINGINVNSNRNIKFISIAAEISKNNR